MERLAEGLNHNGIVGVRGSIPLGSTKGMSDDQGRDKHGKGW